MTGYGKHTSTYNGRSITVEVKTLNSKQADLNLRLPSVYREKEFEIRDRLSVQLVRGKIDLTIQRELAEGESTSGINKELVAKHFQEIKELEERLGNSSESTTLDYLALALKMPDVFQQTSDEIDEKELQVLMDAVEQCISNCLEFRRQEGEKLELVLRESTEKILGGLIMVEPLEQERIDRIRGRISNNLSDEGNESTSYDRDRFEQELIYYMEKLDISEEKVRLRAHCEYFVKTMAEEEFKGKKLSFIAQEMGREINTLGSKAQHSDIQRIVVGMKDELEKIKEQVLNVL
ncbi:MAG: DUF1732 domain-containing protein [Flavobacteriales bacterium]